jgi:E3 ubiquitin-protein ligase FANCL
MKGLLFPAANEKVFAGLLLGSRGESFRLALQFENGNAEPQCAMIDPALRDVLTPFLRPLTAHRRRHTMRRAELFTELGDLADRAMVTSTLTGEKLMHIQVGGDDAVLPASFYDLLLKELHRLGWHRLVDVDPNRRIISLSAVDASWRRHGITISLPLDYPRSLPTCVTDLPMSFQPSPCGYAPDWEQLKTASVERTGKKRRRQDRSGDDGSATFTLMSIVEQWESLLQSYQALWDQLDDLDDHTWILEPERVAIDVSRTSAPSQLSSSSPPPTPKRPPRHTTHRRVAMAPHASILLRGFDPRTPYAVPSFIRFFGRESAVAPFRARFNRTVQYAWDASGETSLRRNLEVVLGIPLPCPTATSASLENTNHRVYTSSNGRGRFIEECAICYTHRLSSYGPLVLRKSRASSNDTIPEVVCPNLRCGRVFHNFCLSEWLRGLPGASRSFQSLFGHCPYCFEAITAQLQSP